LDPHQYPTAGGRTLILRAAKALHSPFDTATVGAEDIMTAPYILFTSHRGGRSGCEGSVEQPREVYEGCRVRFVIPLLFRQHPTMRLAAHRGSQRLALFRAGVATFQRFHQRPQGLGPIMAMCWWTCRFFGFAPSLSAGASRRRAPDGGGLSSGARRHPRAARPLPAPKLKDPFQVFKLKKICFLKSLEATSCRTTSSTLE